jgi:hypothetical protein
MVDIRDWIRRNDWIRQIANFNLVENNATASVLFILVVLLILAGNHYAGSALGLLLLGIFLIRKLPELKSLHILGLVSAEWRRQVERKELISVDASAESKQKIQEVESTSKQLLLDHKEKLPADVIAALQQMTSNATLAVEKLTIVESANTDVVALLRRGPVSWIHDGSTVTAYEERAPSLTIGSDNKK